MTQSSAATVAVVALLLGSVVGAGLTMSALAPEAPTATTGDGPEPSDRAGQPAALGTNQTDLRRFGSASAYTAYVRAGSRLARSHRRVRLTGNVAFERSTRSGGDAGAPRREMEPPQSTPAQSGGEDGGAGGTGPSRVGTTNVQVTGLDEPDVLKTDGNNFYYAPDGRFQRVHHGDPVVREPGPREPREPVDVDRSPPVKRSPGKTHVVDISEPADPALTRAINTTGKLLQTGDTLVVIEAGRVVGYNVSNPAFATETWSHPLNASLVTARERNGTVYLVTATGADPARPCPIEPLGSAAAVSCGDVFHPNAQIPVDATYTAMRLDAANGSIEDAVSFVGTRENSVVYMSNQALYVTYTKTTSEAELLAEYALKEVPDIPDSVADRIHEIRGYNISTTSTEREIRAAIARWIGSLPAEERKERRKAVTAGFQDYKGEHKRNLTRTGIVRVDVDAGLSVEAVGTVPGRPLNQFSMSEYNGTLRVATTIPATGSADSENDLYTLEAASLDRVGAVQGMGVTERVYAVRYVGDTAYVVTFRRIDPFHVVDLSDPTAPEEVGELELPGFSSYLHPVEENHVLGIGEENGRVKAVLFDVSEPGNPTIADEMRLEAHWSAIAETHHAFMQDEQRGVAFIPVGETGLVVDYTDGKLTEEARIGTNGRAQRARYVDNYLYVFGDREVVVVDQTSWNRVDSLTLEG